MIAQWMSLFLNKDFIPLYQTIIWIIFIIIVVLLYGKTIAKILEALIVRIEKGSEVSIGSVKIGEPPKGLRNEKDSAVTHEGVGGVKTTEDIRALLDNKQYPDHFSDRIYLIHASEMLVQRTKPNSGRYRVKVWIEAYDQVYLDEVESVTYRLYDDFNDKIISTTARDCNYELWLSLYGEFTVVAYVKRKGEKSPLLLSRYLDLPGRPPD